MTFSLTGLYIWKNCVDLGYTVLESYLTTRDMVDDIVLCVDPTSDDITLELAREIEQKDSKARIVWFKWPNNAPGDGSVIGIASNFALAQARTSHVINIQADEVYPTPLMEWTRDNWKIVAGLGYDCFRYKVLNTEHNAQRFQGGQEWDGDKRSAEWDWQRGAGYNTSFKLAKRCPAIRLAHDAWTFENCTLEATVKISFEYPIVHLHDMFRDSLIALRRTAADTIWTDRERFGHYKVTADSIESSVKDWWDDPMWTEKVSPFDELLPEVVKPLIGQTSYRCRLDLI